MSYPRAPRTWSVFLPMLAAGDGPIKRLEPARSCELTGCTLSLALTEALGGQTMPTLNDIVVKLSTSGDLLFTTQHDRGIENASDYVDVTALETADRRTLGIVLDGKSQLIIEARWKVPTLAASFADAVLGLNFWGEWLTPAQYERRLAELRGDP
jgi:hypothetical protein